MKNKNCVLIVEDNPDHTLLIATKLQRSEYQYETLEARNSEECFSFLKKYICDLILLDYDLPEKNGLEVLEQIKKNFGADIPVIMVTGFGSEEVAAKSIKAGAVDYIVKSKGYLGVLPIVIYNALTSQEHISIRKQIEKKLLFTQFSVDNMGDAAFWTTEDGKFSYVNNMACQLLRYSHEELLTMHVWDVMEHIFIHNWQEYLLKIKKLKSLTFESIYKRKDGVSIHVEVLINYLKFEGQQYTCTFVRDITERKQAEDELRRLQYLLKLEKRKLEQVLNIDQRMSSIRELNYLVDFIINKSTKILNVEKCSLMLLDEQSNELIIKGAKGLDENIIKSTRVKVGDQISGFVAKYGKPLLINDIKQDAPIARKVNRPSYQTNSFMSVPIQVHNRLIGVVNVADKKSKENESTQFSKIDLNVLNAIVRQAAIAIENANYYRELTYLSICDSLTGLYNHRHFIKSLDYEIRRLKRYSGALTILMIDVDNLKSYNDTYGHIEGDCLLKMVSGIFRENSRCIDIVCRYAGDEFVIILPFTNRKQSEVFANKILCSINTLKLKCPITLSIGMASYAENMDRRDLIIKADRALYEAKRTGKNKLCYF